MKDSSNIVKEVSSYFISKLFPAISGVLLIYIITRISGIEEYGKYSLAIAQFNFIVSICFGWLNQSHLRYGSKESYFRKNNILKSSFNTIFFFIVIFFICACLLDNLFFKNLLIALFCIFSIGIFTYLKSIFQTSLKPNIVVSISLTQSILLLITPIFFFLYFEIEYQILLISTGLSFFLSSIFILYKERKVVFDTRNKLNANTRKWFLYGFSVSLWGSIGLLFPFFDRFFINYYYNESMLGIYSSTQELSVRVFSFLIFPITMALHPRITKLWNEENKQEAINIITLAIKLIFVFFIFVFLIVFFQNNLILNIYKIIIPMLDKSYAGIVLPLVVSGIFWQLSFFTHKLIELKEQTYLMLIFIILSLIINIFGNTILLPTYGIIATSYTSMFSAMAYFLLSFLYFFYNKKKI